jgi:DNA-binding NarL/FixJ family response regulator
MAELRGVRRDTVLVVDDTPESLGFLTDTLDGAGYTVLIAIDGESALRLVEQITPDLVLLDAVMPGIDGFETCRRLKQKPPLAHLPVIFMTGLAETEHVVQGLAAGGVDYVTKPIVVEELLARMRVHLANARIALGPHAALDASGRFLLATDHAGRIKWCTPKARALLHELWPGDATQIPELPEAVLRQMLALRHAPGGRAQCVLDIDGMQLECAMLSPIGPDELLFRLSERRAEEEGAVLQQLGVTSRESEVLLWLSRGKSNREIGEILGISPRTVNKHLEQIFVKLGVENRASAAARAARLLAQ